MGIVDILPSSTGQAAAYQARLSPAAPTGRAADEFQENHMRLTLIGRQSPLAAPHEQLRWLAETAACPPFAERMRDMQLHPLHASGITVFQINVGKLCNQTCRHCHVDAGPDRQEMMSRETAELCIRALEKTAIPTVDITGGAPELNPNFRWLVEQARARGRRVMDRCNLSVLLLPAERDLGRFLAAHQVEVIASLPYFQSSQTDAQRGGGVFEKSIRALRLLNGLGYGREGTGLVLNLVHNPVGAFLPPRQAAIEARFREELMRAHGVVFSRLYTITNMPISRFLEFLIESGNYDGYMERLANAFNPAAATAVMCRYTISVGWDGTLYDCDFNQMLDLPVSSASRHIKDFDPGCLQTRRIVTGNHCYGCTAGTGSSCGGALSD
jgi:radical SAM/Cys-rich protein